ncbi:MAG: hypothetical protein A2033_16980 [Bacteroidetes bacterium GWA2_31_9]|nr:MAG: hypothetical protein A2033_16980 [Bacteroidetes bacterium GWA2_31_9]
MLILIKIIVSVIIVLTLVYISERNPKLGGIITGLPLGTGIMISFYSYEHGIDFVLTSLPYGIAGMISTIAFGIGFYLGGKNKFTKNIYRVILSLTTGLTFYLFTSYILSFIKINFILSIVIFLSGVFFAFVFYRKVSDSYNIVIKTNNFSNIFFRIILTSSIVLLITGSAGFIGTKWAGLIASFPTILCPLLIILAFLYNGRIYPVLLKHLSYAVSNILVFYLIVNFTFPVIGAVYGIILAYFICILYLLILNKLNIHKRKIAESSTNDKIIP